MKESFNEPRIVMANYNDNTIRVYQAFNNIIAEQALRIGTFGSAFKMERMTWIKPSFLWMMYRSGWGTKPGQERILAIDIERKGFEEILYNVILSTYNSKLYGTHEFWEKSLKESDVRCQWDPDRDIHGNPIGRRAIQLGLSGAFVRKYVNEWIAKITDISEEVYFWQEEISKKQFNKELLPLEAEYPVNDNLKSILGM